MPYKLHSQRYLKRMPVGLTSIPVRLSFILWIELVSALEYLARDMASIDVVDYQAYPTDKRL